MNLRGLSIAELKTKLSIPQLKSYSYKQVYSAMYKHGITDFREMTSLSLKEREFLSHNFDISSPKVVSALKSIDGTRKWLLEFGPKTRVETVFIPDDSNSLLGTLCVSSQVGCSLKCSFCHTGTQKFLKNLTIDEIIGQVMLPMKELNDFPLMPTSKKMVDNIVFMGQGEPLYNFKNVSNALNILSNDLKFAKSRITVSTSGVVPLIPKLAEYKCGLAISLHAANDSLRDILVPLNKTFPIKELLKACEKYLEQYPQKTRITFEYVLLDKVNDSLQHAKELVSLLGPFPSLINLIPWNPWPNAPYKTSQNVDEFHSFLKSKNMQSTVRKSRGSDIMAACGQLKSSQESKTPRE